MFVATSSPPTAAIEPVIENDGWFPSMEPAAVRGACLLDGTVTAERLRPALIDAMLTINRQLQRWADTQRAQGHASLADVPGPRIAGESARLLHYRRAVHACLQADLAEAYRIQSDLPGGTGAGKKDTVHEALAVRQDEHRRNQRWAVADLMGTPRSTVELI